MDSKNHIILQNQHLIDHNYHTLQFPYQIVDHDYAAPIIKIKKEDYDENVPDEDVPDEDVPDEDVPNEDIPYEDIPYEDIPDEDVPNEDIPYEDIPYEDIPYEDVPDEIIVDEPNVYRILPGVQRNTKIYLDKFGYKYYKKKLLVNKITLICERQRNRSRPMCHGTASISKDETDKRISIGTPHNHEPQIIDMNVSLLRDALGERCLDPIRTQSVRSIYNSEIIRHQEAAKNYTFKQTQARVKRMRRLRLRRLECNYL